MVDLNLSVDLTVYYDGYDIISILYLGCCSLGYQAAF